jgi:hypothetical protein
LEALAAFLEARRAGMNSSWADGIA